MSGREQGMEKDLPRLLSWSKGQGYRGYSKHDALNSPLLAALSLNQRLPRLVLTQSVMRLPWNVRPLLGVPRRRNPKGIGLFAHALMDLAESGGAGEDWDATRCREEAEELLGWLVGHASPWTVPSPSLQQSWDVQHEQVTPAIPEGYPVRLEGLGWGYHYPWQDVGFYQPRDFPNRVVTSWIGFAFVRGYEVTGQARYLEAAEAVARFLLDNPNRIVDEERHLCLSYVPLAEVSWAVMDVSLLAAALLARVARHLPAARSADSRGLYQEALRLTAFVVDKQTDEGAWFYTWPADGSHIRHDNYHTGIILDALADYMAYTGDHQFQDAYRRGLVYYREHLFLDIGAPRWMNDRTFPHDIHGAAAGILAFTRAAHYFSRESPTPDPILAGDLAAFADTIQAWTCAHLQHRDGYFHYQRTRWMTKRFCLMRWCNAWMARALAQQLRYNAADEEPPNLTGRSAQNEA